MSVSARLSVKTRAALDRYCKHRGVTKTQALEQGIQLLLESAADEHHASYLAFMRLRSKLPTNASDSAKSSMAMKRHLDAKYPA
jgi:hypothetical protein